MKATLRVRFFLSVCLFLMVSRSYGQCPACTATVNGNSVTSYTVYPDDVLCVPFGLIYTGVIYLQGGTVCNSGTINDIVLRSGTVHNYGTLLTPVADNEMVELGGKVTINNYTGSKYEIGQELQVSSGSGSDSLCIVIPKGSYVTVGTNLKLNSGRMRISVGLPETTENPGSYATALNVAGNMVLSSPCLINVEKDGAANITGHCEIKNPGNKILANRGTIAIGGHLYFSGDGGYNSDVLIDNYSQLTAGSIGSYILNANVSIRNNAGPLSRITTGAVELSHQETTINNNAVFEISGSLTLSQGAIENAGDLTCASLNNMKQITNNRVINVSGDFTNAVDATLVNNAFVFVGANFSNYGTCNLGKNSMLKVFNFDNVLPGSIINGPPDILDDNGNPDDANYGHLVIDKFSRNAGILDGYLDVIDIDTPGGVFDAWEPKSIKGPNVLIGVRPCVQYIKMGYFTISPNKAFYCPGENISILFTSAYQIMTMNWNYSGTAANLYPGSHMLDIVGVQSGGVVTYSGTYFDGTQYCPFSFQIVINMGSTQITAPSPLPFAIGTPVTLNSTVSNATPPVTFNWQPNVYFVPPTTNQNEDPIVQPDVSILYTVTATDAYGCVTKTTVEVIAQPYAHLNKIPDGGYYKLFANKLLFKFDAQYANTTLNYKVFDKANVLIASNTGAPNISSSLIVKSGDNRYYLDASPGYFITGDYYTLEVTNEKKEKLYLRFIK